MLPTPCFVFSDVHLGVAQRDVERRLLGFLAYAESTARSVVINGDLFDFWFEWRTVMPRTGFRVLAALSRLREAGIPVTWIAGNHDCWGSDLLRDDLGVDYHAGPLTVDLGGWRTRFEHGDGLRSAEDRRYRVLRAVLRHRWSIRAFRWIHPDLGSRIALGSSHASRTYRARDGGEGLRQVARAALAPAGIDLLVYGHSHVAHLERFEGGVYANPGNWMDDTTWLSIAPDAVRLHRWSPESPALVIASEPRQAARPAVTTAP